ncbi:MAG: alpha/beta hydrolase [Prevotellaceae bacterium]|nr:alpha/beta hydrolase [Prevotellaceae bacterium]
MKPPANNGATATGSALLTQNADIQIDNSFKQPTKRQLPHGYTLQKNLVYTHVNGWKGHMDLHLPPKGDTPSPVILNIHGGGFIEGSKDMQRGFGVFYSMGFTVANISYRLANVAPAPAAIEDVHCAIAYLVQNAKELHIDPTKIVTRGSSAGGHLALMGGLLCHTDSLVENCSDTPVQIAAIVDICAPANLTTWHAMKMGNKSSSSWLGARKNDMDFVYSISPIAHINKRSPPVFIAHGDADATVPYEQSVALLQVLQEQGVHAELYTVCGGGHDFSNRERTQVNEAMCKFLKDVLNL